MGTPVEIARKSQNQLDLSSCSLIGGDPIRDCRCESDGLEENTVSANIQMLWT